MFDSKLGVVRGESLEDDMEGCGEELVLIRLFALGGDWPNGKVEIIRLLVDSQSVGLSDWTRMHRTCIRGCVGKVMFFQQYSPQGLNAMQVLCKQY